MVSQVHGVKGVQESCQLTLSEVSYLNQSMSFQICSLLRGGIAERGGVRVGHRIIEINGQSVVAVPHEKIVNLLATSVGEVSELLHDGSREAECYYHEKRSTP